MTTMKITAAPPTAAPKRDKDHEVSRTIHINRSPVDIDFSYDYDPADPEASAKRKEAAFEAALKKLHPTAKSSRGNKYWYTV